MQAVKAFSNGRRNREYGKERKIGR